MSNKVLLVTDPDDIFENGLRISIIGLTPDQSNIVSKALMETNTPDRIIAYIWNNEDSMKWLIDKIYKSNIIIFNADHDNQLLSGFLASRPNSYYFGSLKDLGLINSSVIYDIGQCKSILEKHFEKYINP